MESPYTGRAIIQDNFDHVVITIPAKRNWFIILFTTFWMGGWFLGETSVGKNIFTNFNGAGLFMIFWLSAWTVGGAFALSMLIWNLIGKEIITVFPGVITIRRVGSIFFRARSYDLNEAKHFRAEQESPYNNWGNRYNNYWGQNNGTIKFEYGMKTIRFADSMDEAEANYILDILRNKMLIK